MMYDVVISWSRRVCRACIMVLVQSIDRFTLGPGLDHDNQSSVLI